MSSVIVRNVNIGEGIPKICAPIVGRTKGEVLREAKRLLASSADLAEWRADWFEDVFEAEAVAQVLKELRAILEEMPLLFTFRTLAEGGEKSMKPEAYAALNRLAIQSGAVDLLDVELSAGDAVISDIIAEANKNDVKTVVSSHDFSKTPEQGEIIRRLCKMQLLGADILKIAVMPQTPQDVLTLLLATEEMRRNYAERPLITMAMSGMGIISRLCGELFGSAVTFGAAAKASAPGQIGTEELAEILLMFHQNLQGICPEECSMQPDVRDKS